MIVLHPNKEALHYSIENNKGKNTPYDPSFYYELVDILDPIEGLWERWKNRPNSTFAKDGKFHGVRQIRHGYGKKESGLNFQQVCIRDYMWHDPAQLEINYLCREITEKVLVSNISEK